MQPKSNEDEVRDALALPPTNTSGDFERSLLVTYFTRNLTVHHATATPAFLRQYSRDMAGHLLNALALT